MNRKELFVIVEYGDDKNLISRLYDRFLLAMIFVSLVPLTIREQHVWTRWIEIISCLVFLIDYILRWFTADYRLKKKGVLPFIIYPFTIEAIFDLLSILPGLGYFNSSLKIFRIYRLFRIVRVVRIFRLYEPLQIMISVFRKEARILLTVIGFALFYILITAMFMFNVEQINPATEDYLFDNFFEAVYWATCTLTTVGYGDIYPVSEWGRLVSMVSALVGIAIIALPSGIITAGYMEETRIRKAKKHSRNNRAKENNVG